MSYLRALKELHRRHYLRMSAYKCPYCGKPLTSVETDDDPGS